MIVSRLGRIIRMMLALAVLVGGYGSMAAHAGNQPVTTALVLVAAPEDVHDHGHSHDLDDEDGMAGHEHKHDPSDHSHDVPKAAVLAETLSAAPRTRETALDGRDLLPVTGPSLERPPRGSGQG